MMIIIPPPLSSPSPLHPPRVWWAWIPPAGQGGEYRGRPRLALVPVAGGDGAAQVAGGGAVVRRSTGRMTRSIDGTHMPTHRGNLISASLVVVTVEPKVEMRPPAASRLESHASSSPETLVEEVKNEPMS
jgi:hypothetical protein